MITDFSPLSTILHFHHSETVSSLTSTGILRVVQTQAILFLKSMSKRVGSDIQRHWNWISRSTPNRLKMTLCEFRVVLCRIRPFPTFISIIKWLWSELHLNRNNLRVFSERDSYSWMAEIPISKLSRHHTLFLKIKFSRKIMKATQTGCLRNTWQKFTEILLARILW